MGFSEIMSWGCDVNYLQLFIFLESDEDGYPIYKIKNKYYKYDLETQFFKIVKPKYRKVLYFE